MTMKEIDLRGKVVETKTVASAICDELHKQIGALLLSPEDEVMLILSVAHGKAKAAGFDRSKLEALRAQVFDILDSARRN